MAPRKKDTAAKEPGKALSKLAAMQGVLDKVLKDDDSLVIIDEDSIKVSFPHLPTGSVIVDFLIGGRPNRYGVLPCPGFPRGRLINLYGQESAGKTTLCLTVCAQVAARGGSTCYIDWEHDLDLSYAKSLGVPIEDPDRFRLYRPETMEKGLSILWTAAKAGIDLIVLDSTGAAVPKTTTEQGIDEKGGQIRVGLMASKWSQFLPEMKGIIARSGSCVVGISQLRKKIATGPGAGHGDGTTIQGGEAWKFYSEVRIGLKRIAFEKGKVYSILENKMIEDVIRSQIVIKVDKCKVAASQGMQAKFFIHHGEGIDDTRSIIEIATAHGLIKKDGNWLGFEREGKELIRFNGMDAFKNGLKKDPGAWEDLYRMTLERLAKVAKDSSIVVEDFGDEGESDEDIASREIEAILNGTASASAKPDDGLTPDEE